MSRRRTKAGGALEGLNEAQRYAVSLDYGPILVIAGAGTGKTRTLTHRVVHLVEGGVDPGAILLLTFTRRAAEEMLMRARALHPACTRVEGGTFHSTCHRLLRRFGPRIGLDQRFTVLDVADSQQIIKGAVEELGLKSRGERGFPKNGSIADVISKSRNLELGLDEALERHYGHLMPYLERIEAAAGAYAKAKRDQNLVDYDDLLFLAERLLSEHADLRAELHGRWQHLLVDEYQDTNAVQARLVELLAGEKKSVMVVGDDAQSIYAFRGARLRNILEFPKRFPGARLVKLEQNYRSTQPILDFTNRVIAQAAERYEKDLFTELKSGPSPELLRPREQRGQSRLVTERIRGLMAEGARPEEIAVLFRAGRDSFDLEAELRASHIPFVKYGGIRFVELAHVKDVMSHLRVVVNPRDYLSWQRLLMLLPKVGPATAQRIIAHLTAEPDPAAYVARLASAPAGQKIEGFAELCQLLQRLAGLADEPLAAMEEALNYYQPICTDLYDDYPRRLSDLAELPALAEGARDLGSFLAEAVLDPPEARLDEPAASPVTLSTVHSAKGKEWAHVIVIWLCEGRLPAFPALDDPQALEEELRLFYVACTRAGRSLTLVSPREHYQQGAGLRQMAPSRFVEDLPPEVLAGSGPEPVFAVPTPAAGAPPPASRGTQTQDRPFRVGSQVLHATFGKGKVMGYKGQDKIIVHFGRMGLKILVLKYAGLQPA